MAQRVLTLELKQLYVSVYGYQLICCRPNEPNSAMHVIELTIYNGNYLAANPIPRLSARNETTSCNEETAMPRDQ